MKGCIRDDPGLHHLNHPLVLAYCLCCSRWGRFWERHLGFFTSGPPAQRQRLLIEQALGPVWEANHVWLIFLIVGLFTAFPSVFATVSVALFLPFTLALIGIVLRGAAFVFHAHADGAAMLSKFWS